MSGTQGLKRTPFTGAYPDGVAEWIDVFGYATPVTWGDPGAEHGAVRNRAAAMDFSMLLKWDIRGPSAVDVVDRVFSRDVARQKPGRVSYGVVTSEAGMMVDDCTVFLHDPEHVRMFGANPRVGEFLAAQAPGDVAVTQLRDDLADLSVQGPKSREILQRLTGADLSGAALPYYSFVAGVEMAGIPAQISRIGYTGELGFEVLVPADRAVPFWDALFEAGSDDGLLPAGAAAVMMCRIEAGMIMGEIEYDETMTPYECRMGWAVDLRKGEFQGKSALARAKASPRVDVVSVVLTGEEECDGAPLTVDGERIGHVTMAIPSPHLGGRMLGLARVDVEHAAPGTVLDVGADGGPDGDPGGDRTATIVHMPVYDPQRTRVRR